MHVDFVKTGFLGIGPLQGSLCSFVEFGNSPHEVGVPYLLDRLTDVNPGGRTICLAHMLDATSRLEQDVLLNTLRTWVGTRGLHTIVVGAQCNQRFDHLLDRAYSPVLRIHVGLTFDGSALSSTHFGKLREQDWISVVVEDNDEFRNVHKLLTEFAKTNCHAVISIEPHDNHVTEKFKTHLREIVGDWQNRYDIRLAWRFNESTTTKKA